MRQHQRDREFQRFYEAQRVPLTRFALLLCGDRDRAADLVQEALLRTYRSWGRIRSADPGPYTRRTIVNLVRKELRRKRGAARAHRPIEAAAPSHERHVDNALLVADALRTLSPIRRAVVILRFYEDLPETEVARLLDRPIGTVKSDIHRALKRLREVVDADTTRMEG
jgi:RNA polymerase sigma-70 factor (sigma-E family)